jgi:hypothetical protein
VLQRTPAVLRALLEGLPAEWTECREGPGTWSPHEVVAHLIVGERTDWIPRARIILEQSSDTAFVPFDRFAHLRDGVPKMLPDLLDTFAALRVSNVATLRRWQITPTQLELRGVHPEFGPVTLRQLLATWVAHDLGHLVQVARTMARQYRDDAGPWQAYLSVLQC